MSSPTASGHPSEPRCRFLALPPEIRNVIYDHAFSHNGPTFVDAEHFSQPPLLRTCHQIRMEAGPIYYYNPDLSVVVENFNHKIFTAFTAQSKAFCKCEEQLDIHWRWIPATQWKSLLEWCRAYAEYEDIPDSFCAEDCESGPFDVCCAATAALEMVREVRDELEWEKIEKVLEIHKRVTGKQARGLWAWT